MEILNMNRREGKTTELIKVSSVTNAPIICRTRKIAEIIKERAKEMDLEIPNPITIDMYKNEKYRYEKVLIDDIDLVLKMYLNAEVLYVTTSCEVRIPISDIC